MSKISSERVAGMVQSAISVKEQVIVLVKKCRHSWMPEATIQDAGGILDQCGVEGEICRLSHWQRSGSFFFLDQVAGWE